MAVVFPDVRDALSAVVREALTELAAAEPSPTFMTLPDVTGWSRYTQDTLMARQRRVWNHPEQLIAPWWWAKLPSMAEFEAALAAHPELRSRVDTPVGFPFQTTYRDLRSLLIVEVLSPLARTDYDFDEVEFAAVYEQLEAGLLEDDVHMVELVPLLGFNLAATDLEVPGGLSIRPMTDRELSVGLQTLGVPAEQLGTNSLRVSPLNQNALVKTHTFPIQLGHLVEPTPLPFPSFEEPTGRAVIALRLVCGGSVTVGRPMRMQAESDFGASNSGFGAVQTAVDLPDLGRPTILAAAPDVELFASIYQMLAVPDVVADRPLQMALRRIGFAGSRGLPEDRLVDLMIAAEALFVTRPGFPRGGSKSDKIAAGAVQLLSGDAALGATDQNIEQVVLGAYRRRNREMHADAEAPRPMYRLDGTETHSLPEMVGDLERIMRRAAVLVVQQVAAGAP